MLRGRLATPADASKVTMPVDKDVENDPAAKYF
jgi:hypothetical protein